MIHPDTLAQAHARLERSRQRLLDALGGSQAGRPGDPASASDPRAAGRTPRDSAARPHPNSAFSLAMVVVDGALEPMATRHPWRLMLGAASVGAVVAVARPWRWVPQTLLVVGALRPWLQPMLVGTATRTALAMLASRRGDPLAPRPSAQS